ncbi:DUF4191 domain-containing protein [Arcanobacterium hippocoleae]|uniref:DUF4191 domain-containing protein n=1 Tax=Arcanobacterium hippocoleae TaxID=149017 RepID=UPI003340BF19
MVKADSKQEKAKQPKKKRWYSYLADAYQVSRRTYPWTGWALLGISLGLLAISLLIAAATGNWILWTIFGVMIAITAPLFLLTELVKRASYQQIEDMPGASSAVMGQIKRGWAFSEEPVRFNPRSKEMVFRAIGRPGVVLVAEGNSAGIQKMIREERQAIKRVAPSAPVSVILVGKGAGQVPLAKLQRAMRKLPKQITNREVAALATRLQAVNTNQLPLPKELIR